MEKIMSPIKQGDLPDCAMKRIITHWTAGSHKASQLDKQHYHFIVEADGNIVKGNHSITDNVTTRTPYAAHTRGCNSGSIGIALACMHGAVESPFSSGRYPMTQQQWEKMIMLAAQLCRHYFIPVTAQTVLSHAEVQANLGIAQRGKWDIARLSFAPDVKGAKACGDLMRDQIARLIGGA